MPAPRPRTGFFARAALGLWLCGIGVLGLLQFWLRAFRPAGFQADTVAWLWLAGAMVVLVIGLAAVVRAEMRSAKGAKRSAKDAKGRKKERKTKY